MFLEKSGGGLFVDLIPRVVINPVIFMYQKVKSVERALKIMELLREKSIANDFVSPREAAKAAGISSVSAYNIINTLAE